MPNWSYTNVHPNTISLGNAVRSSHVTLNGPNLIETTASKLFSIGCVVGHIWARGVDYSRPGFKVRGKTEVIDFVEHEIDSSGKFTLYKGIASNETEMYLKVFN